MLLVFGGIIAVAETYELEFLEQKLRRLEDLLSMDVLTRVENILGNRAQKINALYCEFLDALDNEASRSNLSLNDYENTVEFKNLRKIGREFKDELLASLSAKYANAHPIHKALLL